MPYSVENKADMNKMRKRLEKTYSSVSDTAVRQAIHVWSSVYEDTKDEGRAWASVYSQMNERGLAKQADVVYTTYEEPSYEVDVAGIELEFTPNPLDGSVKIDMGEDGEGGYVVLDPQQFAQFASEMRQAITFVEGMFRVASDRKSHGPSVSRVVESYRLASKKKV